MDRVSTPDMRRYFVGRSRGVFGGEVAIFFVSLFNQLISPITCVLVFLLSLRLGIPGGSALVTSLVYGFGTAAWAYAHDFFPHPLEALLLLFAVYLVVQSDRRGQPRHALLIGLVLALLVLTRVNMLVVTPLVWLYLVRDVATSDEVLFRHRSGLVVAGQGAGLGRAVVRRIVVVSLAFWLPIIGVMLCILYLNVVRFGAPWLFNPLAQAYGFTTRPWVGLYGNLLSVGRSVFLYSPPLLLALAGWRLFLRQRRAEASLFLALIVTLLVLYSLYQDWHGGWAWGPRYLVPLIPLLITPLGYWLTTCGRVAWVFIVVALGGVVQLLGILVNYIAVHQAWEAMQLKPELAYLYVTEISPIPSHARALRSGDYLDIRLLDVYQELGAGALFATVIPLLILFALALALLVSGWRRKSL